MPGDVGDEIASAGIGDPVDQLVDHRVDGVLHARGRPRSEGLGHQTAQPPMFLALHAQDGAQHPVIERAGRYPARRHVHAGREDEPGVAKYPAGEFVAEHLGPQRSDGDRRPLAHLVDARGDLVHGVGDVVVQRRQACVEDAGCCGVDGHRVSLGRNQLGW